MYGGGGEGGGGKKGGEGGRREGKEERGRREGRKSEEEGTNAITILRPPTAGSDWAIYSTTIIIFLFLQLEDDLEIDAESNQAEEMEDT